MDIDTYLDTDVDTDTGSDINEKNEDTVTAKILEKHINIIIYYSIINMIFTHHTKALTIYMFMSLYSFIENKSHHQPCICLSPSPFISKKIKRKGGGDGS